MSGRASKAPAEGFCRARHTMLFQSVEHGHMYLTPIGLDSPDYINRVRSSLKAQIGRYKYSGLIGGTNLCGEAA